MYYIDIDRMSPLFWATAQHIIFAVAMIFVDDVFSNFVIIQM